MRKTLIALLAVALILPLFCFGISADPEGTAISSAEDFKNMTADGKYYLAADITLTDTWGNGTISGTACDTALTEPATAFTGTIDGNGHTVTLSKPMFADFSGTIKNLTMNGSIESAFSAAPLAVGSTLGMTVENVINNCTVNVVSSAKDAHAGGFVCYTATGMHCVFTDCVNNAVIDMNIADGIIIYDDADAVIELKPRAGGIAAICNDGEFTNCVNNGKINCFGYLSISGGIVGRGALKKGSNALTFVRCVNNGEVIADDVSVTKEGKQKSSTYAGGISGYLGCKSNVGVYTALGCVNNAKIVCPYECGGIFGYAYASTTAWVDIQFCISAGDLYFGKPGKVVNEDTGEEEAQAAFCSPFVAYTNSTNTTILYNISTCSVKLIEGAELYHTIFVGVSSATATSYNMMNNYVVNPDQFEYYSYATAASNEANRVPIAQGIEFGRLQATTLEEIKSGKVAYEIDNENLKFDYKYNGTMFYQQLGTDDLPTVDSAKSQYYVLFEGGQYVNGAMPEVTEATTEEETEEETNPPKTKAPDTTPATPTDTTTKPVDTTAKPADTTAKPAENKGCGGFAVAAQLIAVAICGVIGVAVIKKH